jgi:cyanamide hydratase family protein with HD domain
VIWKTENQRSNVLTLAGAAIVQKLFPQWSSFLETYFLTCMLHDIGTTDVNLHGTKMSFEYYGAFTALNFLREQAGAPKDQAEAVAEAIVRHADIGETGNLTSLGQLIQLSTLFGESNYLVPTSAFSPLSKCIIGPRHDNEHHRSSLQPTA